MRGTRTMLAGVLLAAASLAVPPAVADDAENAGRRCGFASSNDTTGVIQQDENVQIGVIRSATWAAADVVDDDSAGGSHLNASVAMTVHCWIQVNSATPAHFPIPEAHCDFTGTTVVAGGHCAIQYTAALTDNVYLCTHIDMTHNGHTHTYDEDEFPDQAGIQCPLAISASTPPSSEVVCTFGGTMGATGTASVSGNCVGDGHDRGNYNLTMVFGSCSATSGNGTMTGTTDGQPISNGTFGWTRTGSAVVVEGSFHAINHPHTLNMVADAACSGFVTGTGAVTSGVV